MTKREKAELRTRLLMTLTENLRMGYGSTTVNDHDPRVTEDEQEYAEEVYEEFVEYVALAADMLLETAE